MTLLALLVTFAITAIEESLCAAGDAAYKGALASVAQRMT